MMRFLYIQIFNKNIYNNGVKIFHDIDILNVNKVY